jgi:hypothetical protein
MPDQNQLNHEKFTAERIVSLCGEDTRFSRFGNPTHREPDTIFTGSSSLGIEITTAYYYGDINDPNFHAREEWQFIRNPTFDERGIHQSIDPVTGRPRVWDRMVKWLTTSCQVALDDKCSKQYAGVERLWLGIYAVAPVTESREFDLIVQKLMISSANPFERIFILHVTVERSGGYRALQFFPTVHSFVSA